MFYVQGVQRGRKRMKICTQCKKIKVDFYKSKSGRDGLKSECKECQREYKRKKDKYNRIMGIKSKITSKAKFIEYQENMSLASLMSIL